MFRAVTALYRVAPPLKHWGIRRGYLTRSGWIKSNWTRAPVDASGEPLPWYTYPAIEFLGGRIKPSMRVFEYGSGQSTRWWARHVAEVHAVEDDREWFDRVARTLPANVDLRYADSAGDGYVRSIAERGAPFDVVVIDGSVRDECARECIASLTPEGVVVFDNTEEPQLFGAGLGHLADSGFRRIDFYGVAPLNMDATATSVLYRPGRNCFGL
jgi:hypothetical protein